MTTPHPGPEVSASAARRALFTALLAGAAVAANAFPLSLFFGVELLFGSVAALLALVWLGFGPALLVAAAGGAYTLLLWGHPYALIIFVAEIVVIGGLRALARRRGRPALPLAVASVAFWLLVGVPLVLWFYRLGLGLNGSQTLLIALKQPLNGIFNAALASLILLLVVLVRQPRSGVPIVDFHFATLLAGILLPGLLIAFADNRLFTAELETRLGQRLHLFAHLVARELDAMPPAEFATAPTSPALNALRRLFGADLLGYEEPQVRLAPASDVTPTDGVARLHLPDHLTGQGSRMKRYREAHYELALPHAGGALIVSVSAASLIERSQRAVMEAMQTLTLLTLIALLVAWIGSRHLSRLLRHLNASAHALPAALRERAPWIAPPPSLFVETDQLATTLTAIANSLDASFRALDRERLNFRAFFDSMGDLIFVMTPEGRILAVNPAVERTLGYRAEALTEMTIMALRPAERCQECEACLALVTLRVGMRDTCALPLVTREGDRIPVAARIWRGQWNGQDCLFGVCKDLSDELAARDALRAERDLFSAGPVFTIIWGASEDWPVHLVSSNVADILGYPPAEMMADTFRYAALIHPDDLAGVVAETAGHIEQHRDGFEQSYRLRLDTGEYRWFYAFTKLVRDARDRVVEIRGYLFDQSHLRNAEEALARERQRLTNVIDGTRMGTWERNLETDEVVFNERWAGICGYRLAELAPTSLATWRQLVHPDDLLVSEERVAAHLSSQSDHYVCELRMRHRDGHWVWVSAEGRVVTRDAMGRPQIFAGTHSDISERHSAKLELKRRESLDRLLVDLAGELVNLPPAGLDACIARSLGHLGHHLDRAFVCLVDERTDTLSKTHEWTAADVAPRRAHGQGMALAGFPAILQQLRANATVSLPNVPELSADWVDECARLASPETRSLLLMPLIHGGRLLGIVGLDAVRLPHRWSTNKRDFLRVYANLLTSAIQRERTDRELRESLAHYDRLAEQTRSFAWEVDAQGLYTYVGPLAEPVLGWRPGELVGKRHFYELAPAADRATLQQQGLAVFARHALLQDFVNVAEHRDGRRVWLLTHGQPFFDADGALLGYRGADQDITERQESIDRLAASERRLRTVFDHAPMAIAIGDGERRLSYANQTFATLVGRDLAGVLGRCVDEMSHPEDLAEELGRFMALLSGQHRGYRMNKRYVRPNGEVVWGDLRVTLMPTVEGEPPLVVGIVEDITEKLATQADNLRLQRDLETARERETIGYLASGIAHDFNNLLGVIDANLYYLDDTLRGEGTDPEVAEILGETRSALGHAKIITAGMLSLSRAGGIACERVALRQVFDELTAILRQLLPSFLDARIWTEDGLFASSNGAFLQAALLNLVLNARDAMPDGGQLSLEACRVSAAPVLAPRLGEPPPGAHLEIRVSDTGHGMRPETLERIFEPLFSTKAKQRGHGLGLFMVQEFVIRTGAALAVVSHLGEGSEFRLLLPIDASEPVAPSAPVARPIVPTAVAGLRVLLVEDDPRVRESVGRLLTLQGIRFVAAEHGAAGLERLRQAPDVDLVLSDIAMPVLDGIDLFRTLARERPDLPVILMTGQDLQPHRLEAVERWPLILPKPLDPDRLMRAIGEACRHAASGREAARDP
ncbi:PAS domain S-box protein [uncultured Thiocystis sp.]|jgi:PAS domain S-box-containing protein|uniref:PAS domain S-box protein n=1 Tax=uncultured Thiocystis sp. TaxID=1202134 RepID=UPI0025DF4439|nr:PAS domain S-box protein [uncultured Thiocystis sp.]